VVKDFAAEPWKKHTLFPASSDDPVTLAIQQTFDRIRTRVFEHMAQLGLNPPQSLILQRLNEDGPVPMRRIAELMACDASYVTTLADQLEGRGMIVRQADPDDRRVKLLVITETGRQVAHELFTTLAIGMPGLSRLSGPERDELVRLLTKALGD
jgi:DNA-binding MarR family transcriptional regulator